MDLRAPVISGIKFIIFPWRWSIRRNHVENNNGKK